MSKIINYDLLTISSFLEKMKNKRFPQQISYAIVKNIKIINKEKDDYQDTLNVLLLKYSEHFKEDEYGITIYQQNGLPIIEDKKINQDFYDELNELLAIENDINLYKINEEAFNYASEKYDDLTGQEILDLMSLLCDEKEDK